MKMLGKLIFFIFVLVLGWLAYAQFLGTDKEQKISNEVIDGSKKTIRGIMGIFEHEKEKLQNGRYNESINKIIELLEQLKTQEDQDQERIDSLKDESQRLKQKLNDPALTDEEQSKSEKELKKLIEEIDAYIESKD